MMYFSFVASGIDARCNKTRRAFNEHGADLYEHNGQALLDFTADKSEALEIAVEKAIDLVKAEGGVVEQVWTQG